MKTFFVVLVLLLIPFSAHAQEVPCPQSLWYDEYTTLMDTALNSLPAPEDSQEVLADKTITLYVIQFNLEALLQTAPDCAQTLVRKSSYMIALWADFGMLVLVQQEAGLSPEEIQAVMQTYSKNIDSAVRNIQFTTDNLYLVEGSIQ